MYVYIIKKFFLTNFPALIIKVRLYFGFGNFRVYPPISHLAANLEFCTLNALMDPKSLNFQYFIFKFNEIKKLINF